MAKRTLIIVVDSENNSTSFIPQDKFTTSEFKAVADQLRKNAAKLSMHCIKTLNICECGHRRNQHETVEPFSCTGTHNNTLCFCPFYKKVKI